MGYSMPHVVIHLGSTAIWALLKPWDFLVPFLPGLLEEHFLCCVSLVTGHFRARCHHHHPLRLLWSHWLTGISAGWRKCSSACHGLTAPFRLVELLTLHGAEADVHHEDEWGGCAVVQPTPGQGSSWLSSLELLSRHRTSNLWFVVPRCSFPLPTKVFERMKRRRGHSQVDVDGRYRAARVTAAMGSVARQSD